MCDANIVAYFKSTLIPAASGLDSLSRLKLISFLAGVASAFKTPLPVHPGKDTREQFTSGRNNEIKNKMLASFQHGQVNINNAYFEAGVNLSWRTLYDLVFSPTDRNLQDRATILLLGEGATDKVVNELVVQTINIVNYEFRHELDGKTTHALWSKAITQGIFEQMNVVEREKALATHIGTALGYYLELPSSDVNSLNSFYETAHRPQVALYLSAVNELINLDLDLAISTAKAIWLTRATIVGGTYSPTVVLSALADPANEEVPAAFKEDGWLSKIMDLAPEFEKMILEIKSIQDPENADVRTAMHYAEEVPVTGFKLMRNLMEQ